MREYQLPRRIMKYSKFLSYTVPYVVPIINSFLNSGVSTNHDKVKGHSANALVKIPPLDHDWLRSLNPYICRGFILYYKICFGFTKIFICM